MDIWRGPEGGDPLVSVTIMTTEPNAEMRELHDRMPVILEPKDFGVWLDRNTSTQDAHRLLRPATDGTLTHYPVSREVNSPKNDRAELIERAV